MPDNVIKIYFIIYQTTEQQDRLSFTLTLSHLFVHTSVTEESIRYKELSNKVSVCLGGVTQELRLAEPCSMLRLHLGCPRMGLGW